jgi:hypothetical protein
MSTSVKRNEIKIIKASLEKERFSVALKELQAKIKKANEYNAQMAVICKKLGIDVSTTKELESYLEESTGIKNIKMASDSLNVKEDYLRILELSAPALEAELITVNAKDVIEQSPECLDILRDRYTPYVAPEFTETAQRFLNFKEWYQTLTWQEQKSFVQFGGTSLQVKLDSLTYVHR